MNQVSLTRDRPGQAQFSLAALFEYTTLCGVLLALSGILGLASSVLLMGMGLALGARQGLLALTTLMAASLAADWPSSSTDGDSSIQRQLMVMLLAALLIGWYRLRRRS